MKITILFEGDDSLNWEVIGTDLDFFTLDFNVEPVHYEIGAFLRPVKSKVTLELEANYENINLEKIVDKEI